MNIQKKLLALVLALPLSLYAQDKLPEDRVQFGIKLGVNLASLNTQNTFSEKNIVGVNSGLVVRMPITKKMAFQPELCFMGNGSSLIYNNGIINGSVKYNLNYLQLPVLLDYKLNKHIHFQAGPYASILLTSDIKNNLSTNLFDFEKNIQYVDFNKWDIGLIGGTSFHLNSVSIGLRYNLGWLNVANDKTILGSKYSFANGSNRVASIFVALTP